MIQRKRRPLSAIQSVEVWRRWKARESLHAIGRADPFPAGTLVQLRILRGQGVFETKARVLYAHDAQLNSGMGLAFQEMAPNQQSLVEEWLAEIVAILGPLS